MNKPPLTPLLDAARQAAPPEPPPNFPDRVLRAIQREPQPVSVFDQLATMFPRLAVASVILLLLAAGTDRWFVGPDLADWMAETTLTSSQWIETPLEP